MNSKWSALMSRRICWLELTMILTFWRAWSLLMRVAYIFMIQISIFSCPSGILQYRKKERKISKAQSQSVDEYFGLATVVLCITNTQAKANRLTKSNTKKFSIVFMRRFVVRNRVYGNHANATCILITSWPIVCILFGISWQCTKLLTVFTLHIMTPCDFWLLLNLKMSLKGSRFDNWENIMNNMTIPWTMFPKQDFQKYFQH
jgi:Flp pilus assembly protein TadB